MCLAIFTRWRSQSSQPTYRRKMRIAAWSVISARRKVLPSRFTKRKSMMEELANCPTLDSLSRSERVPSGMLYPEQFRVDVRLSGDEAVTRAGVCIFRFESSRGCQRGRLMTPLLRRGPPDGVHERAGLVAGCSRL